ncbi:methyltransferase domain-containing protein [Kribbella sindirgiensis]|uniref:Methyltransferase domain-containing protein n=1 Tax=Kribbella sindirgiensis TaxID=1124744 RepID=A0A4R0IGM9_9ACTN|nr:methyltransferase domain-containing protein [Kribbella sindirgiensis]TCC31224.1 methyltransferase domain-containing protein [Kribbella sindirgiensis]
MQLVLVRTVTGLEHLAAEELAVAGHRVVEVGKRQLVVEPATESITESPPRLADDLFVVYAAIADPGCTKAALTGASDALRRGLESPADRGAFAVSASCVGVRNFNRYDVEDLVGERLSHLTGGRYHSRRHGITPPEERSEWRVVLDGKTMWLGLRPYAVPLHRREWRQHTVRGSLHPPVAAAMARLAAIAPGHDVVDPFCGAGTLLLEAHLLAPTATYVGLDRDPAAIEAARTNGSRTSVSWCVGDARQLSVPADRIITNPPWDVRLPIGDLTPYTRRWRQSLHPNGLLITILNHHQTSHLTTNWTIHAQHNITIAGRHPQIVVADPR